MKPAFLDLETEIRSAVGQAGGFVNAHAHIDRAYTLTENNFRFTAASLQEKWGLVDEVKRTSTVDDIYDRMAFAVERQIELGTTVLGTFIDADDVIGDKAIRAAERIRTRYDGDLKIVFINQTLKGVLTPDAYKWFLEGAAFVDILGGLPGKDKGHETEHLDVILSTARKMGKPVHVHVDQFNSASETETELLCRKTREYRMEGKVSAIHGISVAAHPKSYRESLYTLMKDAGVNLICCPSAWIDSRRSEELAPTHNAIAPIEELRAAGIPVAIGSDNIADIYKPFSDGNMWTELRFLLETCHYYDVADLVRIATVYGREVLGIGATVSVPKKTPVYAEI